MAHNGRFLYIMTAIGCALLTAACPTPMDDENDPVPSGAFVDPDLELAVRDALGLPSGPITPENLAALTVLNTGRRLFDVFTGELSTISTLAGLEGAVNLETLIVPNSVVSETGPIQSLSRLTTLRLNPDLLVTDAFPNRLLLSNISGLVNLTGLQVLDLRGNKIQFIDSLEGLAELTVLDLANNPLVNIQPLALLTSLRELDLGGNPACPGCDIEAQLRSLESLTNLTFLDLSGLGLSNLNSLLPLTNLQSLDLGNNEIRDLRFIAGLALLEDLDLSRNGISNIEFLGTLTNLRTLNLEAGTGAFANDIADVVTLQKLTNLEFVDLTGNPLDQDSFCLTIKLLRLRGVQVRFDAPTTTCPENVILPEAFPGRWNVMDCFRTPRQYVLSSDRDNGTSGVIHVVVRSPGNVNIPGETEVLGQWSVQSDTLTIDLDRGGQSLPLPIISRARGRFVTGSSITGGEGCSDTWTQNLVEGKAD